MIKLEDFLNDAELEIFHQISDARARNDNATMDGLCSIFSEMRYSRGIKRFEVGKQYFRMDGKVVTVIGTHDENRGYETVICDDVERSPSHPDIKEIYGADIGYIHRYNRSSHGADNGRVTGTDHLFTHPLNLIAEAH